MFMNVCRCLDYDYMLLFCSENICFSQQIISLIVWISCWKDLDGIISKLVKSKKLDKHDFRIHVFFTFSFLFLSWHYRQSHSFSFSLHLCTITSNSYTYSRLLFSIVGVGLVFAKLLWNKPLSISQWKILRN